MKRNQSGRKDVINVHVIIKVRMPIAITMVIERKVTAAVTQVICVTKIA